MNKYQRSGQGTYRYVFRRDVRPGNSPLPGIPAVRPDSGSVKEVKHEKTKYPSDKRTTGSGHSPSVHCPVGDSGKYPCQ